MKMATQTKGMQVDFYTVFVPNYIQWIHVPINEQGLIKEKNTFRWNLIRKENKEYYWTKLTLQGGGI